MAEKGGLVGGYVEGSLVAQNEEEAHFGLLELLLPGQDLRRRRISQLLSGPTLACTRCCRGTGRPHLDIPL